MRLRRFAVLFRHNNGVTSSISLANRSCRFNQSFPNNFKLALTVRGGEDHTGEIWPVADGVIAQFPRSLRIEAGRFTRVGERPVFINYVWTIFLPLDTAGAVAAYPTDDVLPEAPSLRAYSRK